MTPERTADFLRPLFTKQANVDRYARALWLRHMEGMTYQEIAAVFSVSYSRAREMCQAAETRIFRRTLGQSDQAIEKRRRVRAALPPQMIAAIIPGELPEP